MTKSLQSCRSHLTLLCDLPSKIILPYFHRFIASLCSLRWGIHKLCGSQVAQERAIALLRYVRASTCEQLLGGVPFKIEVNIKGLGFDLAFDENM